MTFTKAQHAAAIIALLETESHQALSRVLQGKFFSVYSVYSVVKNTSSFRVIHAFRLPVADRWLKNCVHRCAFVVPTATSNDFKNHTGCQQ